MIAGYFINGAATPFILVAAYTALKHSLDENSEKKFDPHDISDFTSGLYNACVAFGGIAGPLFGSYLTESTNFRTSCDVMSLILFVCATLQFILIYVYERLKKH